MKLVSVIIPIYNVEKYLDYCIASVVDQTYKNLEIILVDDGSMDNCSKMCDSWAKKDSRIKVIHKKNGGLSSARNAGLEISHGDYIQFVDGDDYIDNTCIDKLVKNIKDNDLVVFGHKKIFNDKVCEESLKKIVDCNQTDKLKYLINRWDFGFAWNKFYSRKIIDVKFDESKKLEDIDFNSRVFKSVKKFIVVEEPLYNYVQQANSLTHNIRFIGLDELVDTHKNMLKLFSVKQYKSLIPYQNAIFLKNLINIFKYDKYIDHKTKKTYDYLYKNQFVKDALKYNKPQSFKLRIFIFLIKFKMINVLKWFI